MKRAGLDDAAQARTWHNAQRQHAWYGKARDEHYRKVRVRTILGFWAVFVFVVTFIVTLRVLS